MYIVHLFNKDASWSVNNLFTKFSAITEISVPSLPKLSSKPCNVNTAKNTFGPLPTL